MSRPGGFRRRREAEDPNNTWNMQLFTAMLTKNFTEATSLLEKGANVNHSTSNAISTASSSTGAEGGSPSGTQQQPNTSSGQQQNAANDKQNQHNLVQQQQQQKLLNTFLRSGGTVPLCVAIVFRASGIANFGDASPGGADVSPPTISVSDAVESLTWLYEHGCNLNAVVEPFATLSAAQIQQQQQQQNIPTSMTSLQRPVNGTMFHMCVYFDWSETLEKLLALRIKLVISSSSSSSSSQKPVVAATNEQEGEDNTTDNNNTKNPDFIPSAGVLDKNGTSPAVYAITTGKLELAKILLRHLAPFDFTQKIDHEHTLLGRAAATNDVVLAEILLQLGDDPDQLDIETGKTLLQLAWSAFNRQSIDPALALPSNAQLLGPTSGNNLGSNASKSMIGGAGPGGAQQINVFNPSQLLQQQQQTLAQQQQVLPSSVLTAAPTGAAASSKADKNDPNAGLQMQLLPVLLNRGFDINKHNIEGKTLMTYALDNLPRHLALSQLDIFVQNGGNIDAGDLTTGRTPLMAAVDSCDIDLMRKLIIDYRAEVNAQDAFGASALHRACACGRRIGLAEQLLAYEQTKINLSDIEGQTPLHRAALRGRQSTVKFLISKEACDVNAHDEDGNTPLHLAVRAGHYEIVDLLVSLNTNPRPISAGNKRGGGASAPSSSKKKDHAEPNPNRLTVDAVNVDGLTALEIAVAQFRNNSTTNNNNNNNSSSTSDDIDNNDLLLIVAKLLSGSASVHRVSQGSGLSLLQQAVIARSSSLVESFLSRSADIHHRCAKDKTALHYATENQDVEVVKSILKAGAVVNAQDTLTLTAPLHIACSNLHTGLVSLFIEEYNANVNITNSNFQTPLHIICDCAGGDDQTPTKSNIIIDPSEFKSEDVEKPLDVGTILLQRATRIGRLLLSRGARGNSSDRWQRTPLHYAAASDAITLFRDLLVHLSHQVWIRDENGSTPLHLACAHKAVNVAEFICGLIETRHQQGVAKTRSSKDIALMLDALIAEGKEKIAAGSSRAVKAGASYARPTDPLVQMNQKKFNLDQLPEGAASAAARNILEAEEVSNEIEGWRDGLKMKDGLGRTAMLLAAQAGSSEIGKLLSGTQKYLTLKSQ